MAAFFFCVLIILPILAIILHLPFIDINTLKHLSKNVLPRYIFSSAFILLGTLALCLVIGLISAYLIAFYKFFGSKFFEWFLILPLAIPSYVMGFVWIDLFEFQGLIPTLLGVDKRIDIMNSYGVIVILSFALYPYVYFFAKNTFAYGLGNIILSAKILKASNLKIFFKVILPFCRVGIVGALLLVAMEVLSDYGLVAYFGVDTFSAGIFRTWGSGGDEVSAIALSVALLVFIALLMFLEKIQRGKKGFTQNVFIITPKEELKGFRSILAFLWCFLVVFFAFIVPIVWLIYWACFDFMQNLYNTLLPAFYSFSVSLVSSFAIVIAAFYLCFITRLNDTKFSKMILYITTLGYSLPGAVVAVGILVILGVLNYIFDFLSFEYAVGGGFLVLFFGYFVRFLASGIFATQSGYERISKNIDYANLTLKSKPLKIFTQIHFPLMKHYLALAMVIICVDILKELPISTILSPSGFQTLSSLVFAYSETELIYNVSLPSLIIVVFGVVPTYLMHYLQEKNNQKEKLCKC
ncbi:iron ABC transporter permease [Campylobacter peloridis]|uniref:Iron ABC transporter permease n=1 Tax=Campylobacter peloridis TaxID=488546 RepID=A0ABX6TV68_9BACT|nr:iron ABC transporter permease [Campylobacter peloridis]QOQ89429.1 iron ABC transporter permease [Campylobacter peloridis]